MAAPLPVALRIGERPLTVAVDAAFALSPYGLLSVMALAGTAQVYVPRSLLGVLDNHEAYRRDPAMLAGPAWGFGAQELERLAAELEVWRRAWHFGRLAARVHWIGDLGFESMPADREDSGLPARFEWCAAAFDQEFGDVFDFSTPIDACARDALALAAAVQPDPVLVITSAGRDGPPLLCRLLAGRSIVGKEREGPIGGAIGSALAPVASALKAADAALVEVLAPGALALPDGWNCEQDWAWDDEAILAWDLWAGARAIWTGCGDTDGPARNLAPREQAA